jgi:hypothetical protein
MAWRIIVSPSQSRDVDHENAKIEGYTLDHEGQGEASTVFGPFSFFVSPASPLERGGFEPSRPFISGSSRDLVGIWIFQRKIVLEAGSVSHL